MKQTQFTYSEREIVEIMQAMRALAVSLKLPSLELPAPAASQPAAQPKRAYNVARQRAPSLGECPHCGDELAPSKHAGGKPYCVPCWKAKKGLD